MLALNQSLAFASVMSKEGSKAFQDYLDTFDEVVDAQSLNISDAMRNFLRINKNGEDK